MNCLSKSIWTLEQLLHRVRTRTGRIQNSDMPLPPPEPALIPTTPTPACCPLPAQVSPGPSSRAVRAAATWGRPSPCRPRRPPAPRPLSAQFSPFLHPISSQADRGMSAGCDGGGVRRCDMRCCRSLEKVGSKEGVGFYYEKAAPWRRVVWRAARPSSCRRPSGAGARGKRRRRRPSAVGLTLLVPACLLHHLPTLAPSCSRAAGGTHQVPEPSNMAINLAGRRA